MSDELYAAVAVIRFVNPNDGDRLKNLYWKAIAEIENKLYGHADAQKTRDFGRLSVRARRALCRAGVNQVSDITELTITRLRDVKGCGQTTINEIVCWLSENELLLQD